LPRRSLGEGGSIFTLSILRLGARVRRRLRARAGAEIEMKSAYELAMERLAKSQPIVKLTDDQKKQLAEVDSTFKARIAEKELFLKGEIQKAQSAGKFEEVESLEKQLASDIKRLQEDCEAKKEKLRASFAGRGD
jgi:hypothetical protein